MNGVLLYAMSPTHVISSITAIGTLHPKEAPVATLFVHWPGQSRKVIDEIGKTIAEISKPFSFIDQMITMSSDEKSELVNGRSLDAAILDLRHLIGSDYREVYYAHDIDGGMFNLLCAAYPKAKRICFGDAFGNVYEKQVQLGLLHPEVYDSASRDGIKNRAAGKILRMLQTLRPRRKSRMTVHDLETTQFAPHVAALALPVDQSGHFLRNVRLVVAPRETLLETLEKCASGAGGLEHYVDEVLRRHDGKEKYILLTENHSEGDFVEFGTEIEMYCSVVKQHCEAGSLVLLKSHPGESLPRNEAIKEKLSEAFDVEELDPRFKRYPIELWRQLITESKVICMSYPVLSLKYLYGMDVIQPMDDAFIEKWFPRWTWAAYKNAATLYMEPLKKLDGWDGKGVLWAGNEGTRQRSDR